MSRTKKLMFPTDFSECSDAGLEHAATLARDMGASLLIVHVEEPPLAYAGGEMYYGTPEPDTKALETMLQKVRPTDASIPVEHRLVVGSPAHAICDLAEQEGVDMIIMGTHGRTGLKRLLMGSVAEHVVRWAPCPVLTFKEPHLEGASQGDA